VKDAIRKGHSYVALVTPLDVVCPPNNIIRKHCCHHFVQLQWGSVGQGVRKKVQYCVADAFRSEFPAPNGIYMGHRESYAVGTASRDSHAAVTAPRDWRAAATTCMLLKWGSNPIQALKLDYKKNQMQARKRGL
jgi:hypothetical protein